MATQAELEAAVAALPGKKRRLREAFDRLVACSPVPVPFRWEDLDAHLASVAARFRHFEFDSPNAADAAAAAAGPITTHSLVEHLEQEEQQQQDRERRGERGGWEAGHGSNAEEGEEAENASLDQERGEEEGKVREASSARSDREGDEAGNDTAGMVAMEASPGQDDEADAMEATVSSPLRQGEDDVEMMKEDEAANASADRDGGEDEAEEGELPRLRTAAVTGGEMALTRAAAAARAGMDPSALVDLLCLSGKSSHRARQELLPTLLGTADPHALLVGAVGGFLALARRRTNTCWENCITLIECVPRLAAPSADALEKAERVARDWKEMVVGKAWSCSDVGRMAGWGLLTFLASYNIVLEFDADEITRLVDNVASKMKNNCLELCKRLGLIEKMTGSINHFIENGQPLDAIRLAHAFNLTHKYPPLTIMNDYIENAKKTAEDILSKESYTLESLVSYISWKGCLVMLIKLI
ncbi:hypothetical protein BAE44_0010743 [Dichanthelium oligosanthes]|uniref:FRIGIDA-like protein n=1 Tax=Dichanthelium oligosanthes TaxID=888268 RepID=A0A1E5VSY6_9POAL|nr:hypothetical protein BAE44_0010743 [Dichanthelium oligosanthes]